MQYELRRNSVTIYVGTRDNCEKMKDVIAKHHKSRHRIDTHRAVPKMSVWPRFPLGAEQPYIDAVLSGVIEYGTEWCDGLRY